MLDISPSIKDGGNQGATLVVAELAGGGLRFGVDARQLAQVVPVPLSFSGVPRAGSSLVGVLDFRQRAVPVVDLMRWHTGALGGEDSTGENNGRQHIAVLPDGNQWVGVLVHHTGGLRRMREGAVQRLHHDDDPNEFFHSVVPDAKEGHWLPLLDVSRLMTRARIWSGTGADAASLQDTAVDGLSESIEPSAGERPQVDTSEPASGLIPMTGGQRSSTCRVAVVGIGDRLYGFPVEQVATVLHRPALQTMRTQGSDLMGFLNWRGQQVPLMQATLLLGGSSAAEKRDASWAVVLRLADTDGSSRWLAISCHRIDQVRTLTPSQLREPVELGEGTSAHCTGFFYLKGAGNGDIGGNAQVVRVVDAASLLVQFGMVQSASRQASEASAAAGGTSVPNRVGYVAFRAGKRLAVPIDRLQEILPFGRAAAASAVGEGASAGVPSENGAMTWRGRQIPLVDVAARMGIRSPLMPDNEGDQNCAKGQCRVIVADVGSHLAGLVVGDVDLLIPAHTAEINRTRLPDGQQLAYITTESNGARESCHLLDLDALS